jgi:hypothetical protein
MAEWQRAVAHAGFSEQDVHLWLCQGYGLDGEQAQAAYYKPVLAIEDDRFPDEQQREEAESDEYWERHRVVIFEDFRSAEDDLGDTLLPVMGALLRHELEHARQQVHWGNTLLDIDDRFVDRAVRIKVGRIPGGTELYQCKLIEQDANAAAAMYLREYQLDHVQAIRGGPCASLARSNTPPESLDTLLARTVAFVFQFHDICERDTGELPFWKRLHAYDSHAAILLASARNRSRERGRHGQRLAPAWARRWCRAARVVAFELRLDSNPATPMSRAQGARPRRLYAAAANDPRLRLLVDGISARQPNRAGRRLGDVRPPFR